jgi:archaellum component FlaC
MISVESPTGVVYGQAAQADDAQKIAVDQLLDILAKANSTVVSTFAVLEARGAKVPTGATESYNKGLIAAAEAAQLKDATKYTEAKEKILEAMKYMKKAMVDASSDLNKVETSEENETSMVAGIEDATKRLNITARKLYDLAEMANAPGINASNLNKKIASVSESLLKIKGHISAGNLSQVTSEINVSKRAIGDAMSELNKIIEVEKKNQTEHFVNMTEKRLLKISDLVTKLIDKQNIPPGLKNATMNRIENSLQNSQKKIEALRILLKEGDVNQAIARLHEVLANLENMTSEADAQKPGTSKLLGEINRLEATVDMLENQARLLSKKGVDTSAVLAKLQEARNLISQAVESLKGGNNEASKDSCNQANDIVKEIEMFMTQLDKKPKK